MAALLPVADALARVLDGAEPLPAEHGRADRRARPRARRRSSRRCAPSRRTIVSAMDGYAVRAADVATVPATLKRDRRSRGRPSVRRHGRRRRGGAHLHRRRAAAGRRHHRDPGEHRRATATRSSSTRRRRAGKHIRRAGLDFKQGEVLLAQGPPPDRPRPDAGRRDEPPDRCRCIAARRSRCSATGDELVPPGTEPGPGADRLFQRLRADGAGARAKAPR